MILMLKDKPVYDARTSEVLNFNLLPKRMIHYPDKESFSAWWLSRRSSNTNTSSRLISSRAFGNNKRVIDKHTRGLSLTDCYWLKDKDDSILFHQISPYYEDFWKGKGVYEGGSIPTLYVDGFLDKKWINKHELSKPFNLNEIEAARLGNSIGIPCAHYYKEGDRNITTNFTTEDMMLEQALQTNKYLSDNYDAGDIIKDYTNGLDIIILDAIIGNGDRHPGNFGNLINTNTGELIGPAPVYDFDHALDSTNPEHCILIKELLHLANNSESHSDRIVELCSLTLQKETLPQFNNRAKHIMKQVIRNNKTNIFNL